jgi:hypothetical protein
MVDLEILEKHFETSNARLKEIFTRNKRPEKYDDLEKEEQDKIDKDIATADRIKKVLESRIQDGVNYSLKNHELLLAVDLAWDSHLITKKRIPLTLFAQGKIDHEACAATLENAGFGCYVTKDERGKKTVDLPKFYDMEANLIRSIVTRRLAAQSNKYANLWPFWKYEPRGTSLMDKLKSDLVSQRMDIMADQYDARHHEVQCARDVLLYTTSVDFVRSAWEQEKQVRRKKAEPGMQTNDDKIPYETVVVKEGVAFVNPPYSRVISDANYPITSLNSDTGCEFIGHWDVNRYRDVNLNTVYWNRDNIGYGASIGTLFSTYSNYFSNYYCTIKAPTSPDLTVQNDRKSNVGIYNSSQEDSAVIVCNFFWKLKPSEWGLGNYPHDVWVRFVVGGDNTVLFAEYLPSSPAAVGSHNANDSRLMNISFAMELMPYQDQLNNLFNHLLLCLQADHFKVVVVDKDLVEVEHIKGFRQQVKATREHPGTVILEISRSKASELGIGDPSKVITLVETRSQAIQGIFQAIAQLVQMVERMSALSPQEQGQPAPREISATESNLIAGTTESVYGFISDTLDEQRAARKRIMFESWMVMGQQKFKLPVIDRYPKSVIENAGFTVEDGVSDPGARADVALYTVSGDKSALDHDLIFTSRDGAERPVNTQSATVLVQLLSQLLAIPQLANALSKEQLYEIANEVFRQSGAGYDLKLELEPGEDNRLGPDPNEVITEMQGILDDLTKHAEDQKGRMDAIQEIIGNITKLFPQVVPQPVGQPQGGPGPVVSMPAAA